MAFIDDLIICITGDPSINSLITGKVVYEKLPVDFNTQKEWIVFSYTYNNGVDVLGRKNIMTYYDLDIQAISSTDTTVTDIANLLSDYLINYDDGKIRDIAKTEDNLDFNPEKKVYFKTLRFSVLYINNQEN